MSQTIAELSERQNRLTRHPLTDELVLERYAQNRFFPPPTLGMFPLFNLKEQVFIGNVLRTLEDDNHVDLMVELMRVFYERGDAHVDELNKRSAETASYARALHELRPNAGEVDLAPLAAHVAELRASNLHGIADYLESLHTLLKTNRPTP